MGCSLQCGVERVTYEYVSTFMKENQNAVDVMKKLRKQVVDYTFSEYVSLLGGEDSKVVVDYAEEASLSNCFIEDFLTLNSGEMSSNAVIDA